jgi:hypothetical protein
LSRSLAHQAGDLSDVDRRQTFFVFMTACRHIDIY